MAFWKTSKTPQPLRKSAPDYGLLEDRVMLSAAPLPVLDGAPESQAGDGSLAGAQAAMMADASQGVAPQFAQTADSQGRAESSFRFESQNDLQQARQELVVIDPAAADYQQLVDDLLAQETSTRRFEVVLLDGDRDGLEQLGEILARYNNLDAVHLVSHGAAGVIQLGSSQLQLENVGAYAGSLVGWRDALGADADLLIYGCDLAASEDGRTLIQSLATLTGADVAASDDPTGAEARGGDWDLEYRLGELETQVAFSAAAQTSWQGLLAAPPVVSTYIVSNTNSSGAGSLAQAITDANTSAGYDRIEFQLDVADPNYIDPSPGNPGSGDEYWTIPLTQELPSITEGVEIDATSQAGFSGTPVIEIDGSALGVDQNGFTLEGGGVTIRGFAINRFSGAGIEILNTSDDNTIAGNYLGTDITGAQTGFGNRYGITVEGDNNTIGGVTADDRNLISGNNTQSDSYGIGFLDDAHDNRVLGNYIGTTADGLSALANGQGVLFLEFADQNVIGGEAAGQGNVIAFNTGNGIAITSSFSEENAFVRNSIHSNGLLGIDLGTAGANANDSGDGDTGANSLQNAPVITSATTNGAQTNISVTLNSNASTRYRVEIYSSTMADSSGYGEGETFLGVVDLTTNGLGNASFSTTLFEHLPTGTYISAIASRLDADDAPLETSEFSAVVIVGDGEATFQQGLDSYAGTQDTYISSNAPNTAYGNSDRLYADLSNSAGGVDQALLRFDDLFGDGPGQIPLGSTILSAQLTVYADSLSADATASFHRMLVDWSEGSTWNSLNAGVSANNSEAEAIADAVFVDTNTAGLQTIVGLEDSLQAWSDGEANYGWAILTDTNDNWGFRTSEHVTASHRPALSVTYIAPNTAPVLDNALSPVFTAQEEDAGAPSGAVGTLVSELVDFSSPAGQVDNVTDPDTGALTGIAVTATNTSIGRWWYTTDGGSNWNALDPVSNASALLLAADSQTRLYFQPDANANGLLADAITFRAWDQTTGVNGQPADTTSNGGSTAFSTATDTASLTVNAVNDLPVLLAGSVDNLTVNEDSGLTSLGLGGLAFGPGGGPDEASQTLSYEVNVIPDAVNFGSIFLADGTTVVGTGAYSLAQIQGMQFRPADNQSGGPSFFGFQVTDSGPGAFKLGVFQQLNITPVNDAPVVTTTAAPLEYREGDPPTVIDNGLTVVDSDHANLQSASVQFTGGFVAGQDVLAFTDQLGITGAYDAVAGILSLTGTASVADYQAALRTVTYENTSSLPSTAARTVSFTVKDGVDTSLAATRQINVTEIDNDAPTLIANTGSSVNEGGTDTIARTELEYRDTEQPATAVTYTVTGGPANGQLELTTDPGIAVFSFTQDDINNNRLVYVHDGSNTTSGDFTFDVADGQGNDIAGQIFAITVAAIDDDAPALIVNAGSSVSEGGTETITRTELEYRDTEQPATAVTYIVSSGPANGQLELTTDPGVPVASFTQDDINNNRLIFVHDGTNTTSGDFTFDVSDGQGNDIAGQTFAITVAAIDDDAPTQVANTGVGVGEGGAAMLTRGVLEFVDAEQPATAVVFSVTGGPANGHLELMTNPGAAVLSFTQDDINSNLLVYVHDGTNTTSGDFTFSVTDGQGNDVAGLTFAVTVMPFDDDAPALIVNTGSSVSEGGTDTIARSELEYRDTEQPATAVTYTLTGGPANGQLELTTDPGVAVASFTQDDINNNRLVYVHDGSNTTSGDFTFNVTDGQTNDITGQTFAITVAAIDDDAPFLVANTGSSVANSQTVTLTRSQLEYGDTEQPATAVTFTVDSGPANGRLQLSSSPGVAITTFTQDDVNNLRLQYVHDGSLTTDGNFSFLVSDGQGNSLAGQTFTIAVPIPIPVNMAPVITSSNAVNAAENQTDVLTVTASDADGDKPTFSIQGGADAAKFSLDSMTGVLVFLAVPDLEAPGDANGDNIYSLQIAADDGRGGIDLQTLNVTVTDVNEAPTLNPATLTLNENSPAGASAGFAKASDPDAGQSLRYVITGGNGAPAFAIDPVSGEITVADSSLLDYETTPQFTLQVQVDDNGSPPLSATATFTIDLLPLNDQIPVGAADTATTTEGGAVSVLASGQASVLANDTDTDAPADVLTAVLESGPQFASSFTLNADGTFLYVHDGGETSTDTFTYRAFDGVNSSSPVLVTIHIQPVNDAPVAADDAYTLLEGTTLDANGASGVLANDSDAEGGPLTAALLSGPGHGVATLLPDGSFTYMPDAQFYGDDQFTYQVNDDAGGSATAVVRLTVLPINDAPVAGAAEAFVLGNNETLVVDAPGLLANDFDIENDPLTVVLVSGPSRGVLQLNADGSFQFTPPTNFQGDLRFVYQVSDGAATSEMVVVKLTVNAVAGASPVVAPPTSTAPPANNSEDSDSQNNPQAPAGLAGTFVAEPAVTAAQASRSRQQRLDGAPGPVSNALQVAIVSEVQSVLAPVFSSSAGEMGGQRLRQPVPVEGRLSLPEVAYLDPQWFWEKLDSLDSELQTNEPTLKLAVGSVAIASLAATVGYVFWTLKGGYLLASVLSQMPAWQFMDPLPIFDATGTSWSDLDADEEEDEAYQP
ncbi:cadherin-like domain-containing protein [Lignipirellula cremea]|uniref:Cadherin domain protein n=1 Tax=Lignipirellula cremea TaxID=2528010 RepID=A0A518E4K1_9BACT|nr:cadherin-like domain-containing protein [Lignipirellula cremea]QDU99025.1 Cadherin domain protein [Lignipirellula cremea]